MHKIWYGEVIEEEGEIAFSFPAVFRGRVIEGVRLRFEGGEVVEASAERGRGVPREMLALDDGRAARRASSRSA